MEYVQLMRILQKGLRLENNVIGEKNNIFSYHYVHIFCHGDISTELISSSFWRGTILSAQALNNKEYNLFFYIYYNLNVISVIILVYHIHELAVLMEIRQLFGVHHIYITYTWFKYFIYAFYESKCTLNIIII